VPISDAAGIAGSVEARTGAPRGGGARYRRTGVRERVHRGGPRRMERVGGARGELRARAAAEGEERVRLGRGGVGGLGAGVRRERVADEAAREGGFRRGGIGSAPAAEWEVPGEALLLAVEGASDGEHESPPSFGLASESPVSGSPRATASVRSLCSCK
jgi:hypothetical protein